MGLRYFVRFHTPFGSCLPLCAVVLVTSLADILHLHYATYRTSTTTSKHFKGASLGLPQLSKVQTAVLSLEAIPSPTRRHSHFELGAARS